MSIEHKVYPFLEKKKSLLEKPELNEKYWCSLAERLFNEMGELGYGQTANVYRSTIESDLCLKRINQDEARKFPMMNSPEEEAEFLAKLNEIFDEDDGVIVPSPALLIKSIKIEKVRQKNLQGEMVEFDKRVREDVLVMEQINGPSLEDILNPKEERFRSELPKDFNAEEFFNTIEDFLNKMHEHNIFHRDLHAGNIMIDLETHKPCIIDFGFSRKRYSHDENVYVEDIDPRYTKRFTPDHDNLKKIKKDFSEYLQK